MSHSVLSHDEVAVMSSVNYPSNGLGERAFGPKQKNSSLYVASFTYIPISSDLDTGKKKSKENNISTY